MKLLRTFGREKARADEMIRSLEQRGARNAGKVEKTVTAIVTDVRRRGDRALRKYAEKFDGLKRGAELRVTREEMRAAWEATAPELQEARRTAQTNIRTFAEKQRPGEWSFAPAAGVEAGQIVRPLESVGCYVPGGRYPLPSTLLMTVTPAQVAGVERIVVCSPKPARETLGGARAGGGGGGAVLSPAPGGGGGGGGAAGGGGVGGVVGGGGGAGFFPPPPPPQP